MKLDRAFEIDGWMAGIELLFLASVAKISNNILEIGSFKGRSSRAIADNTSGKLTCVDPWSNIDYEDKEGDIVSRAYNNTGNLIYYEFLQNLDDHIRKEKVLPRRIKFQDFVTSEKYDFIFIDGAHNYESVKRDISKAREFIDNGIIAGHDYFHVWPGVVQAVDELLPQKSVFGTIWFVGVGEGKKIELE